MIRDSCPVDTPADDLDVGCTASVRSAAAAGRQAASSLIKDYD